MVHKLMLCLGVGSKRVALASPGAAHSGPADERDTEGLW